MRNPTIRSKALIPVSANSEFLFRAFRLAEYVAGNPLIDIPDPRFFWQPVHADRGQGQSAYHIIVNTVDLAGNVLSQVWDSGVVTSNATIQITYGGSPLTSDTQYSWVVQWVDLSGAAAPWSAPATFATGFMTQAEWKGADFIGCPQPGPNPFNQLRTVFATPGLASGVTVAQARLYITGLGYYRAFFNGQRLGYNELDPGWTTYPQRVLYSMYDVTAQLAGSGSSNALAVYLGNGWPNIAPNPFNGSTSTVAATRAAVAASGAAALEEYHATHPAAAGWESEPTHPLAAMRLTGAQAAAAAATRLREGDNTGAVRKLRAQLVIHASDGSSYVLATNAGSFATEAIEGASEEGARELAARHSRSAHSKGGKGKKTAAAAPLRAPIASSWQCGSGALLADDVYNGCTWDSRLETTGWDTPAYDAAGWLPAVLTADPGGDNGPTLMAAQTMPPVSIISEMPARTVNQPSPGVYVLDFEQNFSGYVRLTLPAPVPANVTVTLRHAELLQHPPYGPQDGNIYVGNLRSAKATDMYTTRASPDADLVLEPLFTYHGFRYVEVTGWPGPVTPDMVTGLFFRSAVAETGAVSFPAANNASVLNQLQHAVTWGQAANLMSVPSDCPQRDERKGWMGDSGLSQETMSFNFDLCAFHSQWAANIHDSAAARQYSHPDGAVPDTVPWTFGSDPGDPAWQTAYPGVLYWLWQFCGDTRVLSTYYADLKALITYQASQLNATGIAKFYSYYGDWCPPPPVPGGGQGPKPPGSLVSAAAYLSDIQHGIEIATAMGQTADAAAWQTLLDAYVDQYNAAFYQASIAAYGNADGSGLQSANAASLALNLVPTANVDAVAAALASDVADTHAGHWSTGIFGMRWLHRALTAAGYGTTAVNTLLPLDYPSFGYWFNNDLEPATTMNELPDAPFEGPSMNSRNHHMFSSVGSFLYDLAGVRRSTSAGAVGWTEAWIAPAVTDHPAIPFASGSYASISGTYAVSWTTDVNGTTCVADVPEDASVTLSCPGAGNIINTVLFAAYGTPTGACGGAAPFSNATSCSAANATSVVRGLCLGKKTCTFAPGNDLFGDPCYNTVRFHAHSHFHALIVVCPWLLTL